VDEKKGRPAVLTAGRPSVLKPESLRCNQRPLRWAASDRSPEPACRHRPGPGGL